jgi:hypothetical protein
VIHDFNTILKKLIDYQNHIVSHYDIPLTGHFISYRESMINWCPIGRNATIMIEKNFQTLISHLELSSFRRTLLEQVREEFKNARIPVTIKLAARHLLIFIPEGWDKTFAMNHFPDYKIYFLGDRCGDNGNDKELFDLLQPECSFWVDGTQHTKEILEEILIPKLSE